jgi:hypothetical protein
MLKQAQEADWERIRTEPRPAHGDAYAHGMGRRRLQLIVAPSFGDTSVWEVHQPQEWQLVRPRVVKTSPELIVVGHALVRFAPSVLSAYFERIVAMTIPVRPDLSGHGGVDGTMYELAVFGDLSSACRFQWWEEGPEQWQPLVELAVEMHAAFTAAWREGSDPEARTGV